jgi:hypothetical protein
MSGQSGIRGYLIQTIITILNSLADEEWASISVEPNIGKDKVDILWNYAARVKVSQVKSSQNQITLGMTKKWCQELEDSISADEYELLLIGPIGADITQNEKIGKVVVPTPQVLNIKSLINQASNELDKFLERSSVSKIPVFARELMIESLVTKFTEFSTEGKKITKKDFIQQIKQILFLILPDSVNKAAEELKLKYNLLNKIEDRKFELKYDACLEALGIIDEWYLRAMKQEIEEKSKLEVKILNQLELGAKARNCHNKLVLTCDSSEVIDLFRYILLPFEGKPVFTLDIIVDFREAIRKEIGFGNISVDSNRDLSWIGIF